MAEGWALALYPRRYAFFSAGITKSELNTSAVGMMAERGIDISRHRSKTMQELADIHFDLICTVCSNAEAACPVLPVNTTKIHVGFDDPPELARNLNFENGLKHYRRVRDEIEAFVVGLEPTLKKL